MIIIVVVVVVVVVINDWILVYGVGYELFDDT